MQDRLILISDDSNFFEYIIPKLALRKSDELFKFNFNEIPEKVHKLQSSLLIINSENNQAKTLDLLKIVHETPSIVFGYNDDSDFKLNAYKAGMFAYISLMTPDAELKAKLLPALREIGYLKKKDLYRELLVKNKVITENNEVFHSCNNVLDIELAKIKETHSEAVLAAISPDDKSKFIIQTNQLETVILNNIRDNDTLLTYAPNKYFLLLKNTNSDKAKILWNKISSHFTEPVYAGFSTVGKKNREELVNEVLTKLHLAINKKIPLISSKDATNNNNFKFYREKYQKRLEQIITPVFYSIQQLYSDKLFNMRLEQNVNKDSSELLLTSKKFIGEFKITTPGLSVVNIDITINRISKNHIEESDSEKLYNSNTKRIKLLPEEFDSSKLQELLEQFINEFKNYV